MSSNWTQNIGLSHPGICKSQAIRNSSVMSEEIKVVFFSSSVIIFCSEGGRFLEFRKICAKYRKLAKFEVFWRDESGENPELLVSKDDNFEPWGGDSLTRAPSHFFPLSTQENCSIFTPVFPENEAFSRKSGRSGATFGHLSARERENTTNCLITERTQKSFIFSKFYHYSAPRPRQNLEKC